MFTNNSSNSSSSNPQPLDLKWQGAIIAAFMVVYALGSSFYKVDTVEQGVVTRFGAFSHIANEGPHFKLPFGIDHVYYVEVTRIHEMEFGFRKNMPLSKSQARLESLMLTGDLNVAVVEWIVQYKISDPQKYLFKAHHVQKNIRDISISVMRRVVGDKLVSDVLTTDRVTIASDAKKYTQEVLDEYDLGILITKVNLQNVTPPDEVKPAFNSINIARQEKEKTINEAQKHLNKIIPVERGKAEKQISEAEGYAINAINEAKGDALKFSQVYKSYKSSPELTRKRIYLETMEEIFSQVDRLTVIDPKIQGLLPIFDSRGKSLSGSLTARK